MKYYICEGKPDGEYNANSKARKEIGSKRRNT